MGINKKKFINTFLLLLLFFPCIFYGEKSLITPFDQWKSRENFFVDYFDQKNQARVIFIGSEAYSSDKQGRRPTTSEGMGYGLLLSCAYDDQLLFNQFLRYVLDISNNYSCAVQAPKQCQTRSYFLMLWLINDQGKPFWYKPTKYADSFYTSGSATDADIQIAWAVFLAWQKVKNKIWDNNYFETVLGRLDYEGVFYQIVREIRLYDIDEKTLVMLPGNQWPKDGNVFFPGYITPQAFDVMDSAPKRIEKSVTNNGRFYNNVFFHIKNWTKKPLIFKGNPQKARLLNGVFSIKEQEGIFTILPLLEGNIIFFVFNRKMALLTWKMLFPSQGEEQQVYNEYSLSNKDNNWVIEDKQQKMSSYRITYRLEKNHVYIIVEDNSNIDFSFADVLTESAKIVLSFQKKYKTGLFPNMMYFDEKYNSLWEKSFSYDAIRFPLWVSAYLNSHRHSVLEQIQNNLLGKKGVFPFIKKWGQDGHFLLKE